MTDINSIAKKHFNTLYVIPFIHIQTLVKIKTQITISDFIIVFEYYAVCVEL